MKAKFKVDNVTLREGGETLILIPVSSGKYGPNGENEDCEFARYTPGGKIELYITNPALFGKFKPGDAYYVDFTKASAN